MSFEFPPGTSAEGLLACGCTRSIGANAAYCTLAGVRHGVHCQAHGIQPIAEVRFIEEAQP